MKTLIVLTGPTGVGKTELSLSLAERLQSPILNADSRQIYREIPIGTAAPTAAEQARVRHFFVGSHSVTEAYNAGQYERDALRLLDELFRTHDTLLMAGGAMLYIDAVCRGLDEMPRVSDSVRQAVRQDYESHGLPWLQQEVERLDPDYFREADTLNPQRLLHALEISRTTGKPYSSFRQGNRKERPFRILTFGLNRPREILYERINRRVDEMLSQGLWQEAEQVFPLRACNSLQTVGYREIFACMEGQYSREEAIRLIKQNSRHYAKRQLTWLRADTAIRWIDLEGRTTDSLLEEIIRSI